jgi:predicted FMN-binding regulatory protein PaiB
MEITSGNNRLASTNLFAARSASDISSLIRENPLAWLVSGSGGNILATQVPLIADLSPDGSVVRLLGHFGRGNPHVVALRHDGRATALFSGPHGYISPSWFRDRTQAPTWNVTTVKVRLRIEVDDRPECADAVLARLVEHMEHDRPRAWTIADMATRYGQLRRGIVGFYGEVLTVDSKFKLGQNERMDVLVDQMAGLEANGRADLARWMREHNALRADVHSIAPETRSSARE